MYFLLLSSLLLLGVGSNKNGLAAATRVLRGESSDVGTQRRTLAHQQVTTISAQRRLTGTKGSEGSIWSLINSRTDTSAVRMLVEVAGLQELLSNSSSGITMAVPLDSSFGSPQNACFSNKTLALQLLHSHMMVLPASSKESSSSSHLKEELEESDDDSGANGDSLLIALLTALDSSSSPPPSIDALLTIPSLEKGTVLSILPTTAIPPPLSAFPSGAVSGIVLRDVAGRHAHIVDWATSLTDIGVGQDSKHEGDPSSPPPPVSTDGAWTALFIDRVMSPVRPMSLEEALILDEDLSTTLSVLTAANLTFLLKARGGGQGATPSITLLAPTNAAWEAALLRLNLTSLEDLMDNPILVASVASTHLLTSVSSYQQLSDGAGTKYFSTLNTCSQLYSELEEDSSYEEDPESTADREGEGEGGERLMLNGAGVTGGSSASITEADLVGGRLAIMHRLDSVLLPLVKWGGRCRYGQQVQPPSPPPPKPMTFNATSSSSPNTTFNRTSNATSNTSSSARIVRVGGQVRLRRLK